MSKTRSYRDDLLQSLRNDSELAAEYLNASLLEGNGAFLVAIKDVIDAQGGGTEFSNRSGVPRESIYKMFKNAGNPTLANLTKALDFANLAIKIVPKEDGPIITA